MRNVKVEIISHIPQTLLCTIGEVYDGFIVEEGELVPASHRGYEGQTNHFGIGDVLCLIDNGGRDVAVPVCWLENTLKIVEIQ